MPTYKLTVPVMCWNLTPENLEKTLDALRRCKADRVFVASSPYFTDPELQKKQIAELANAVGFFTRHGFETGVWILSSQVVGESDFLYKRNSGGGALEPWLCHADEKFIAFSEKYVQMLASTGAKLIMYDDDFHFYGLCGCRCDAHRKLFAERFGNDVDFDRVGDLAFSGAPNEERRMWLEVMGGSLETFARRMRESLDKTAPEVRLGFCANQTNFGVDGTDLVKLARLFAGSTEPFVRLIGAPYWNCYYDNYELSTVIESTRQELCELADSGVELMSEGDVFPRPRTAVPAAMLECFDTALRADGRSKGILKYMLDYYAEYDYETGYVDRHIANEPLYAALERDFGGKACLGVRVYNDVRRYAELDTRYAFGAGDYMMRRSNSFEGRVLSALSIPTAYDGEGVCGAAFGENARYLTDSALDSGVITDLPGAMILTERGIDVGLREVIGEFAPGAERFGEGVFHRLGDVNTVASNGFREVTLDSRAEVVSYYTERLPRFVDEFASMRKVPAAYRYENADGRRFFVLVFAAHAVPTVAFNSYGKARQLTDAVEWLARRALPAKCRHNPNLYVMCKADSDSMAVGLWNLGADSIEAAKIEVDGEFSTVRGINCIALLEGHTVKLSRLEPYGFAGVILNKEGK